MSQQPHIRFDFADGLRGLAMLAVVLFHYTQTFWFRRDRIAEVMSVPAAGTLGGSSVCRMGPRHRRPAWRASVAGRLGGGVIGS